jgi:hypothetical protein
MTVQVSRLLLRSDPRVYSPASGFLASAQDLLLQIWNAWDCLPLNTPGPFLPLIPVIKTRNRPQRRYLFLQLLLHCNEALAAGRIDNAAPNNNIVALNRGLCHVTSIETLPNSGCTYRALTMQRPPMRALHFRLSADIILRNISGF